MQQMMPPEINNEISSFPPCADDIKTDDVAKSPTAAAAQASPCGPNAEFISLADDASSAPHVCKCKPGYDGDPHNMSHGCRKSSKLKLMCEYQNKSYGIEETFFDGCDKKCVCSEALEVDCSPRCPEVRSADPLCSLVEDAKDPCCKVLACESHVIGTRHPPSPAIAAAAHPTPSLLLPDAGSHMSIDVANGSANTISVNQPIRADGCRSESNPGVYRRRGEVFHIGCESKCVCSHSGSIQCEPRCSLFQGKLDCKALVTRMMEQPFHPSYSTYNPANNDLPHFMIIHVSAEAASAMITRNPNPA